ncbi:GTP-binding protein [Spirosomataceae bacterium TFI 002]|nr:GTP-binding protein [Spirosomataceae bacterium TFI 002]
MPYPPLKAEFVKSAPLVHLCPPAKGPEYAFIGRSNVGKSSLINMLTGIKNLAKTSSTPGKTQLINHFRINDQWYLVDLPGYGFAKVPMKEKAKWEAMTWDYMLQRENLSFVFVLIDCRIPPQKIDLEFVHKLGENGIPIKLLFTKWDKVKPMKGQKNIDDFKMALAERWEILPEHFVTSAERKIGREEVLGLIDEMNSMA